MKVENWHLQFYSIQAEMLNLTSKYLKVENWDLQFYSIQAEMLNNRYNDKEMEI
jgi:hypothetical protein